MSKPKTSPNQDSGVAGFPAKIYLLRTKGSAKASAATAAASSTNTQGLSTIRRKKNDLVGYLWRTFPDYSIQETDLTSITSSKRWMTSGMAFHGECWTQNILEHPNDVVVCTLSQVVEASSPLKYFLSKDQLQSLLKRDDARKMRLEKKNAQLKAKAKRERKPFQPLDITKTLMPKKLRDRIEMQITLLSNMPELDAFLRQDPKAKDSETMERLLRATPGAARMLSVRRMLPSEYERLQGFPKGWTRIDGER